MRKRAGAIGGRGDEPVWRAGSTSVQTMIRTAYMGTDDMGTEDVATATRLLIAYQSAVEAFASAAEVCA